MDNKTYPQYERMVMQACYKTRKALQCSLTQDEVDQIREIADEIYVKAADRFDGTASFSTYLYHSLRALTRESAKIRNSHEINFDPVDMIQFASIGKEYSLIIEQAKKDLDKINVDLLKFMMTLDDIALESIHQKSRDIPRMFHEHSHFGIYESRLAYAKVRAWFNSTNHVSCSIS